MLKKNIYTYSKQTDPDDPALASYPVFVTHTHLSLASVQSMEWWGPLGGIAMEHGWKLKWPHQRRFTYEIC